MVISLATFRALSRARCDFDIIYRACWIRAKEGGESKVRESWNYYQYLKKNSKMLSAYLGCAAGCLENLKCFSPPYKSWVSC